MHTVFAPQRAGLSLHPAHRPRYQSAEDLVSQVFLDVWRTARKFESRSQVSTWLLSIARFKALTALRQRRHEDIDQEDVLRNRRPGRNTGNLTRSKQDQRHSARLHRQAIAGASRDHQPRLLSRKTVEEAGEIIGIPQSTVKTRMFYARKQLAELLRGAGVDSLAA